MRTIVVVVQQLPLQLNGLVREAADARQQLFIAGHRQRHVATPRLASANNVTLLHSQRTKQKKKNYFLIVSVY